MINRLPFKYLEGEKDLVGVEIGVDCGTNALNILQNLDIKRLYLIDPYDSWLGEGKKAGSEIAYAEAVEKLKDFRDKIVWILKKSEYAVDNVECDLDFIYIDGHHGYEYVKKDLELYVPKVRKGGLITGHDFDYRDVHIAVIEYFKDKIIGYCKDKDEGSVDWFYIDSNVEEYNGN